MDTHAQGDVMSRVVNDVDVISDGLLQGVDRRFVLAAACQQGEQLVAPRRVGTVEQ